MEWKERRMSESNGINVNRLVLRECPECNGAGFFVTQTCCGNLSSSGGCWDGCGIQSQEPCEMCGGSGNIKYLKQNA